jgi:putative heme-binding domain-containing protein
VKAGQVLGRLMLKDWSNEPMQTAVLSSVPPHLEAILQEIFHQEHKEPLPPSLVERLVGLTTDTSQEPALTDVLDRIGTPVGSQFAGWQLAGVDGLLDAVAKRDLTFAGFEAQAGAALRKTLTRLEPVFEQARRTAMDPGAEESERLVAIRLAGRGAVRDAQDTERLGELLNPQNSIAIQKQALAALRGINEPEVAQVLLKNWRASGLNERQELLNALFSRPEWTEAVVGALERGKLLPGEIGPLQQQRLLNHSSPPIRERAARLFLAINSDRKKIVELYKDVAQLQGDRAKGHELFTKNCSICHHLRGEGQNIGPNLGTVADKPVQELVLAILDPNQAVDPAYVAYTALTKDDREMSGVLVTETPNSISLKMAGGSEEQILRSNLKQLTSSGRSLMPEGFEAGLKPQDLADLIAFILQPK